MALDTTPRTWTSGENVTAAMMNTEVRDALTGIQAAWTDWDPQYQGGGVAITLGNGQSDGSYTRVGKMVHFRHRLIVGSTTVLPAGTWTANLVGTLAGANIAVGSFMTVAPIGAGCWRNSSTTVVHFTIGGATGNGSVASLGLVNGTTFTWSGSYELP